MIVLDASIVVEVLVNEAKATAVLKERLVQSKEDFAVPHLLDIEVLSALRKLSASGRIPSNRIAEYLRELASIGAQRYPHEPLLHRMWELRHNFGAYDACYIALAEAIGATLYTVDAKLRTGHRAKVVCLSDWVM